jgi:outer membrane biosynthesis protein TonB
MKMLGYNRDSRPPSALETRVLTADAIFGGALFAILAHVLLPIAIVIVTSVVASALGREDKPQTYIEEHVVEARFVQKGKKPDPKKLPDRVVPRKSTAPDDSTVVSKDMNPEPPEKPKEKPPDNAVQDLLTRVGDRAQAFAEIAEEREKEGDPNGLEEGTDTEAQAGDAYVGQLVIFFRRGWTIPNTIADPTKFTVVYDVEIRHGGEIGAFSLVKSSGDPLFDQSAEDRLRQLQDTGQTVPDPPPEVAHRFLGQTIRVPFTGKKK